MTGYLPGRHGPQPTIDPMTTTAPDEVLVEEDAVPVISPGPLEPAPDFGPVDRLEGWVVTGVVAAAGGLGGYFPPLVMGATYHAETNSYALGLWLLVLVGAAALVVAGMLRDARPAK